MSKDMIRFVVNVISAILIVVGIVGTCYDLRFFVTIVIAIIATAAVKEDEVIIIEVLEDEEV